MVIGLSTLTEIGTVLPFSAISRQIQRDLALDRFLAAHQLLIHLAASLVTSASAVIGIGSA